MGRSCLMTRYLMKKEDNVIRFFDFFTDILLYYSSSMEDYKYLFKVVLIGNAGVGKTCLVRRFTQGVFPPGQGATIGVDFKMKTVEVDGAKIKLQIWDTAGQERFSTITSAYYRGASGFLFCYDTTDADSFAALPKCLEEAESCRTQPTKSILIGNKCDLKDEQAVPTADAKAFADSNGMSFFETSAKDSVNVEAAFMQLTGELLAMRRKEEEEATAEAAAAAAAAPLEATNNSVAASDNVSQEKVDKIVDKYMDLDG